MMVAGLGGSADLPSVYRFFSTALSACAFLTGSAWLEGTDKSSRESVASFAGQRLLDDRLFTTSAPGEGCFNVIAVALRRGTAASF